MIYGYATKKVNEYGLLDLREVTFVATPEVLRQISFFLSGMADLLEAGEFKITHRHIGGSISDWDARFPDKDVIVMPIVSPPVPVVQSTSGKDVIPDNGTAETRTDVAESDSH